VTPLTYLPKENILNTTSTHQRPNSLITTLMALAVITAITACSPKPTTEDNAAQTKAIVDQAVVEAKKQLLAEQAAEKTKQEALIAAQAEEKAKQDAAIAQAVAAAKKELIAEQRAAAAKAKQHKPTPAHAAAATTAAPATTFAAPPAPNSAPPRKIVCTTCGVAIAINEVETAGKGSGLGVVAGGVVGGLLGNQVGSGTGRDLATIAGAIGGAMAGNKIEQNSKKTRSYNITVKMETGEEVVFHQAGLPNFVQGDAVRIENDTVVKK
jgi:outer membrane lipoprotein SlyB